MEKYPKYKSELDLEKAAGRIIIILVIIVVVAIFATLYLAGRI